MSNFSGLPALAAVVVSLIFCQCLLAVRAQDGDVSLTNGRSSATGSWEQLLDLEQARQYMLELINRDRKSAKAAPVVLDEVANKAGELHSDEMAEYGYLAHWTMDGRKPDQRYTECGGKDTVAENVDAMNTPNPPRLPLCSKQLFSKHDLEEVEGQFFNEKPPNDGHRVNIIDPNHTAVGIGLSVAGPEPRSDADAGDQFPRVACTQEFINHYGSYADIPQTVAAGDPLLVEGTLDRGLQFRSIDLRWEKFPEPMTIEELDKTYSYSIPDDVVDSYFPPPFESPAPVNLSSRDGDEHFAVEIPTSNQWRKGLYYVCIWATPKNNKDALLVSTRTFKFGAAVKKGQRLERQNN